MNNFITLTPATTKGTKTESTACDCERKANKNSSNTSDHRNIQTSNGTQLNRRGGGIDSTTQTSGFSPAYHRRGQSNLNPKAPAFAPPAATNKRLNDHAALSRGLWSKPATVESLTRELAEERRRRSAAEAEAQHARKNLERKEDEVKAAGAQLAILRQMVLAGSMGS